jgi:tetratricopeptide (TPR) repeat protein
MTMRYRHLVSALIGAGLGCLWVLPAAAQEEGLTPHAHFMSGKLYFSQKVYDKSEKEFRMAVAGDSTVAEYRVLWASAVCEVARQNLEAAANLPDRGARMKAIQELVPLYQTAAAQYSRAVELDPKKQAEESANSRLHYWADLYNQALQLSESKKYETSLEVNKLLTYLDPREPRGFLGMAVAMDKLGEAKVAVILAGQAGELADQRIAEMGDCSQFLSKRRQGECRKEIQNFQKVRFQVDQFTRSKNVALGREATKNADAETDVANKRAYLEEAIMFLQRGLDQDPSLLGVRFDLADASFRMARTWDDAGSDTSKANPCYREAARVFMQLVNNDSTDVETRDAALYNAGQALYAAGSWVQALPVLQRYIATHAREADTYPLVAKCLVELKRPADASAYMRMFSALSAKAESVPPGESVTTARNLYAGSDMVKGVDALGPPEEARSLLEPETGETVVTWIWWTKEEARHYIKGIQVGSVRFAAEKKQ